MTLRPLLLLSLLLSPLVGWADTPASAPERPRTQIHVGIDTVASIPSPAALPTPGASAAASEVAPAKSYTTMAAAAQDGIQPLAPVTSSAKAAPPAVPANWFTRMRSTLWVVGLCTGLLALYALRAVIRRRRM